MNKFVKAIAVFSLVAAVMLGGSAWALDRDQHVSLAPNALGDLLIFPAYFTAGGWATNLTVINSSAVYSVVAKVVFRTQVASQEVKDFLIFLSPNDVWTGSVELGSNGLPFIYSTDDSCLVSQPPPVFASPERPFQSSFVASCPYDTNQIGYVEVFEAAAFELQRDNTGKVKKDDIYKRYLAFQGGPDNSDYPKNVLTGFEEIANNINNVTYSITATVFKNYDNYTKLQITDETKLGLGADNSVGEVEAALSKNNLVVPYYSGELGNFMATFLFPTKLAIPKAGCAGNQPVLGNYSGFPTPEYIAVAYDLSEDIFVPGCGPNDPDCEVVSPLPTTVTTRFSFPQELNFVTVIRDIEEAGFEQGWARFVVGPNLPESTVTNSADSPFYYTEAPVIATSMRFAFGEQGVSLWTYSPHNNGVVDIPGAPVESAQYHYWFQDDK